MRSSLLKALFGKLPILNSQILDWPPYTHTGRKWSCQLFSFLRLFPSIPPFFTSLLSLSGWCLVLLGCDRPSVSRGKFMKGRVVIGLLSSPLGPGMRPDLIRHQDGPLMDMSFNPFPPGGRNGSWRGRGETPRLNRLITFYPNPQLFIGRSYAIETGSVRLTAPKTAEFLTKLSKSHNRRFPSKTVGPT